MRPFLLGINYVTLLGALAGWFWVATLVSINGPMRVTELDRLGVINEEALREVRPELAGNLRHDVGMWIQAPMQTAAVRRSQFLAMLALVNVIGLHLLAFEAKRTETRRAGPAAVDGP